MVRVADLVVSPVMMELQEYRALVADLKGGEEPPELSNNWFSLQVRRKASLGRCRCYAEVYGRHCCF
jgi:hypothetical protein